MFKQRLISGVILVLLALFTIISGGYILFATLLLISLIGVRELFLAIKVVDEKQGFSVLAAAGYFCVISYYVLLFLDMEAYSMMSVIFMLILLMFVYVFTYPKYQAEQIMGVFFGVIYVSVMLSYIFMTRNLSNGIYLVWLIFLCSWGCDTCAYCVGVLFGKHKMAPILSPKKSIEGAIGGVAGAAILGAVYALVMKSGGPGEYAIICGVGALISMVGDLAASAIKRNHEIKDYGKLIPGHGGILDRFDSVIFTAPVIYFLSCILIGK